MTKDRARTIWIVNDDPVQLLLLRRAVERIESVKVETFDAADSALHTHKEYGRVPDLIVTDLHMPGIDGWRFCRILRSPEYPELNDVPILICSATFAGKYVRDLSRAMGAADFVPAPFSADAVREHVECLLAGRPLNLRPVVVLVSDVPDQDHEAIVTAFRRDGFETLRAGDLGRLQRILEQTRVQVLLIWTPQGKEAEIADAVRRLRKQFPGPAMVCLMEAREPRAAVQLLRSGADAFCHVDGDPEELVRLCRSASETRAVVQVEQILEERTRLLNQMQVRYERLFKHMQDGCVLGEAVVGADGEIQNCRIVAANPAFLSMADLRQEKVVGVLLSHFAPQQFEDVLLLVRKSIATGRPAEHTFELPERGFILNVRVFSLGERQLGAVIQDRTEVEKAEQARRASEQAFRTLVETMSEGVMLLTPAGVVEYANPAMAELLGMQREELTGRQLADFIPEDGIREVLCRPKDMQEGQSLAVVWMTARGIRRSTVVSRAIIRSDGGGAEWRCLLVVSDTERLRQAQERAEELERQLLHSQKMEAIGRLAGKMAHDFRNDLMVMMHCAGEIRAALPEDSGILASVDLLQKALEKAGKRSRDLLAFSRREEMEVSFFDLRDLLREHVRTAEKMLGEDVRVALRIPEDLVPIEGDRHALEQAFMNLAVNARDAMPQGGEIRISLTVEDLDANALGAFWGDDVPSPGRYAVVRYTDTGVGIPSGVLDRVFEPYFTTKPKNQGTGIGLALVYNVVCRHAGRIRVRSAQNQGTEFTVVLPVADAGQAGSTEQSHGMTARTPATGAESQTAPASRRVVLLVEDEALVRRVTARMLRRLGMEVIEAESAEAALAAFRKFEGRIDVLVSDIVMTGRDGVSLAQDIVRECPEMAVVLMSGYPDEWLQRRNVAELDVEFLQKPYEEADLRRAIERAIARKTSR